MSAFIPVSLARAMTARYRANRDTILNASIKGKDILPICETFDKAQVLTLLERDGCTQLRCYYSMDEDQRVHLVLVGANSADEDMLPPISEVALTGEEDEDYTIERAIRCPPFCPPLSDLNG